jgi:hypothetical protein
MRGFPAVGRLRLALAAAALAAALLAPASPAHAARGMEVALQDDLIFVQRIYYDFNKGVRRALKLKVSRIRANVLWDVALERQARFRKKPKHLKYNWEPWDYLIDQAAPSGIKVQLDLTGMAPRWATSDHKVGPMRPNPRLYRQFVTAAVKHFKGRVDRYSIWNEPNHRGWLAPLKTQAAQYRRIYRQGYAAIRKADPDAQVLIAETAPYASNPKNAQPPLRFLRKLTCVNRSYHRVRSCKLYADGYAHHPYEYHNPPNAKFPGRDNVTMSGLHKLTRALDKLKKARALRTPSGKALDVYLTEFGYFARGKHKISQKKRAKYTVQAFDMAQRNPRVRQMLYYVLVRPDPIHAFFDTSLIGRRGLSRPFRKLASWAAKAAKSGKIAKPVPPAPPEQPPPGGGEQPPPEEPACPIPLPEGVPCPTP